MEHQLTCKYLMSDKKAGRLVKINTLEYDFAESMVSLDFPTFLVGTEAARAELEEKRSMTRKVPDGGGDFVRYRVTKVRTNLCGGRR